MALYLIIDWIPASNLTPETGKTEIYTYRFPISLCNRVMPNKELNQFSVFHGFHGTALLELFAWIIDVVLSHCMTTKSFEGLKSTT